MCEIGLDKWLAGACFQASATKLLQGKRQSGQSTHSRHQLRGFARWLVYELDTHSGRGSRHWRRSQQEARGGKALDVNVEAGVADCRMTG